MPGAFTDGHTSLAMNNTTEADSATMDSTNPGVSITKESHMLPSEINKECVYMTSEDETDSDTTDSASPGNTPIKMTFRVHKDNLVTTETPPKIITECVYVTCEDTSDSETMDDKEPGTRATKKSHMLPEIMIATPEMHPKIIRDCAYVLLHRTIHKMLKESCNGCKVDHPSQLQHPCLFKLPSDYYMFNIAAVKKRLYCLELLRVLNHVCDAKGIKPNPIRMMGAVDMFFCEREEAEEADCQMDTPHDFINADTAVLISAAIEACW